MLTQEIKDKYIERALMHSEADDFVKEIYLEDGKGSAIACLSHDKNNPHKTLSRELSTPEWVFHVVDVIFEGLGIDDYKQWTVDFVKSIPVGINDKEWETNIKAPFIIYILESTLGKFNHEKFPDIKTAIDRSIELWKRKDIGSQDFMKASDEAVEAIREAATEAIESIGKTMWAVWTAESAASGAVPRAVTCAAEAVACSSKPACAGEPEDEYKYSADELLRLMREQCFGQ